MTHPTDALRLVPDGSPVPLRDCPPGPFTFNGGVGFKTEYGRIAGKDIGDGKVEWLMTNGPDAYVLDSGEVFWGGCSKTEDRDALVVQPLAAAPASPPVEQPFVRTPNEDDRLRRALYRLLERQGAGPDVLSVVGSLWDTLDQGECTDLIEDWLITGKTIQVEGDIDEMLASIPEEAPTSPLPEGGGWQDISTGDDNAS